MTVDDLVKVYCDAFYAQRDKAPEKGITEADRAGVTAIVRALRDEIVSRTARNTLDQILGDAGVEKVAGGSTREDEQSCNSSDGSSPATDAAPAVCVWTGEEYVTHSTSCESEHEVDPHKAPPVHCPSCGKPIKFTEVK